MNSESNREAGSTRRCFLHRVLICASLLPLACVAPAHAHTPYRQWEVYRRKHLLIGCQKDVDATYTLARKLVATLDAELPTAQARVARGPTAGRLASLLGTEQLHIAILSPADAAAMASGTGDFEPYGPIDLRLLLQTDPFLLVSRADVPTSHAWLLADALSEFDEPRPSSEARLEGLAWHPGAKAYRDGLDQPHSTN